MVKTKIADCLSARFKFKSPDIVELVIIDSRTNEIFNINWNFRDTFIPTVTKDRVDEGKDEDVVVDEQLGGITDDE